MLAHLSPETLQDVAVKGLSYPPVDFTAESTRQPCGDVTEDSACME